MAKTMNYNITYEINNLLSFRIKKKRDLIALILECCSLFLTGYETDDNGLGTFELYISKMNRLLFYCEGANKFFSFTFPFRIEISNTKVCTILSTSKKIEVTPYMISILRNLNEAGWFEENSDMNDMYTKIEYLEELFSEYSATYDEIGNSILDIVNSLHSFEPGYIRCDIDDIHNFDESHPHRHPKNHVDINYSQDSTFKIGLESVLSKEKFKSLMNIEEDCFYIV